MQRFPASLALISGLAICLPLATIFADEFEREPINYSSATPHNPISELQSELTERKTLLKFDEDRGYLASVLNALDISPSSQTLVFSKTSLQRSRIAPHTPRAIYFNDDVYIGYCHLGEVLEISVADVDLGTVFYTLDQEESASPQFIRQTDSCLICHSSSRTKSVPGHLLRSIYSNSGGMPIFSAGSYTVDQSTEFEKRWGGWYVTGQHGTQSHLGNLVIHSRSVQVSVQLSGLHKLVPSTSRRDADVRVGADGSDSDGENLRGKIRSSGSADSHGHRANSERNVLRSPSRLAERFREPHTLARLNFRAADKNLSPALRPHHSTC